MAVDPIPEGYPRVCPYLIIRGANDAIDFYTKVLGAELRGDRMLAPDGTVGHAELSIGSSIVMLADPPPDGTAQDPKALGGTPVSIHVYVADVDSTFAEALANGAKEIDGVSDKFYGDRSGTFEDAWGHRWHVSSHIEDVPAEEMEQRAAAAMSG